MGLIDVIRDLHLPRVTNGARVGHGFAHPKINTHSVGTVIYDLSLIAFS